MEREHQSAVSRRAGTERSAAPRGTALTNRILVATDGRSSSEPAVRLAGLLSREHGGRVEAAAVIEAPLLVVNDVAFPDEEPTHVDEFRSMVREQLTHASGDPQPWHLHVRRGRAAPAIVELARKRRVSMLVMGIGRDRPVDRMLGSEMVLQVARLVNVPVLAVAPEGAHLPRHAMVAVDFSRASRRAARDAIQLVSPAGTVSLAHVRPSIPIPLPREEEWESTYDAGVARMFAELERELHRADGPRLETAMLDGEIAPALLTYAGAHGVDLIAVGTHHRAVADRVLLGSITARLVRGSTCSVLLVPQPAARAPRRATTPE
jgi:nucleotide-binding universal stress UspA family protein